MPNRLINETSPYLLQHANNPVDWHPWGEEALAEARELGRPIFLSIGYAACHWCHVMERESFEDPETAALMNEHFVNIKVDREERPDLDSIYMQAVTSLTGRGGWPMSVWLTPDGAPFFGGTYFPGHAAAGHAFVQAGPRRLGGRVEESARRDRRGRGQAGREVAGGSEAAGGSRGSAAPRQRAEGPADRDAQAHDGLHGRHGDAGAAVRRA